MPNPLPKTAENLLHDRMTQSLVYHLCDVAKLFEHDEPKHLNYIDILSGGKDALIEANTTFGFALSAQDIDYLVENYTKLGRNPTDVELMMFAQANSEHCRHKIFNAEWTSDGIVQEKSLFKMIKNTYETHSEGILSAYKDNAAVMEGFVADRFYPTKNENGEAKYGFHHEQVDILMKVQVAGVNQKQVWQVFMCRTCSYQICLKNGKILAKFPQKTMANLTVWRLL